MESRTLPETQPESVERYQLLHRIGLALSSEQNRDRLLETILTEAQRLCHADGGSLYLRTEEDELAFEIVRNDSLGIRLGGTTGSAPSFAPLPLRQADGSPNRKNVATFAAHEKRPVHVPDAYHADGFDFSGTKAFDAKSGYRTKSLLTIPLVNGEGRVIGVLQLLNAQDPGSGDVVPFPPEHQETVTTLASQAALALDNKLLLEAQKSLLESFIKLIAAAIDAKSPYTGGHCERVPILTEMIVQALCEAEGGSFANFQLDDEQWYELKIAAWLHDCGKVTTPVHVMDKATKLETIADRIETVRHRFEVLKRDARIRMLEARLGDPTDSLLRQKSEEDYESECSQLEDDLRFLERANIGGEFLRPEARQRIAELAQRRVTIDGKERALLDEDELENLCIAKGTLTEDERLVINGHMVQTIRMLDALPFPKNLRRVPQYATGHHEKMDGGGYPRGTFAGDLPVPARAMAIADVFEALTAADRPYKKGKTLSEAMRIMGFMKKDSHLDPEIFDEFVRSGVYRSYARKYLDESLIDEVDEAALLSIEASTFALPPAEVRARRKEELLKEYDLRFPARDATMPDSTVPQSWSKKPDLPSGHSQG